MAPQPFHLLHAESKPVNVSPVNAVLISGMLSLDYDDKVCCSLSLEGFLFIQHKNGQGLKAGPGMNDISSTLFRHKS